MFVRVGTFIGSLNHNHVNWGAFVCVCVGAVLNNAAYLIADQSVQAALPAVVALLPDKSWLHEAGIIIATTGPLVAAIRGHYPRGDSGAGKN